MGNNKSLFCLTCDDEKTSSILSSNKNNNDLCSLKQPQTGYEIPAYHSKSQNSDFRNISQNKEEESKSKDEFLSSVFFSFKTEDNNNKTFYSFIPSKSFSKSVSEEMRTSSNLRKSSHFRSNLMENVFKLISAGYDDYECIYNNSKSEIGLRIHLKSYMRLKSRINIFRTEYFAPCPPVEYLEFAKNLKIQKELDHAAEKYFVVKNINAYTDLLYLSYKKTIITSPRDFLYIKAHGEICHNDQTYYCIVGKSIEIEDFPKDQDTIRCEIINSGYVIEAREGGCLIRTYSEFDFKINVPLFIVKNFSVAESKKFVENSIAKLKEVMNQRNLIY